MSLRQSKIKRQTNETDIQLSFNIDGTGQSNIDTGIPFFDHMLDLFTKHGLFDLTLSVSGDLKVDFHHTVEDVGICLGNALHEALQDCKGITRYASGSIPMDEALCKMSLDISNRPYLDFNVDVPKAKVGEFDVELTKEFFHAFTSNARLTLHVELVKGDNLHHIIEAIFKAFGVILDEGTRLDSRKSDVPSTKGIL